MWMSLTPQRVGRSLQGGDRLRKHKKTDYTISVHTIQFEEST